MVQEREHHEVVITLSAVVEGENTFPCTICQHPIVLVASLQSSDEAGRKTYSYSLREEDANDPAFGTIGITYLP